MYRIINELVRPYTFLTMVILCSGIARWRVRDSRWALRIFLLALLTLVLISIPAISYVGCATLEARLLPLPALPDDVEAIVVLSGGLWPPTSKQPRALPSEDTVYRCLAAADLYRSRPCLVVVSGATAERRGDEPPLAHVTSDFLVRLGVKTDDMVLEGRSKTTYENAVESQRILQQLGRRRVALVTDAVHMPRAAACFRRVGLEVTEAPCHFVTGNFEWNLGRFVPSARGARETERAVHEWLGLAWYWLKARI